MRKITLLMVSALTINAAIGQNIFKSANKKGTFSDANTSGIHKMNSALTGKIASKHAPSGHNKINTAFWTDDFSNPATWVISNEVGNTDDWVIGTTGPSGMFLIDPIASTTSANGFALFDSDLLCSGNQIADLTTASSVNCSGKPVVKLSFQQYYRRYHDSTYVFVSNDNVNWTSYSVNANIPLNGFSANDINKNPDTVAIDISATAGNQATVWVRFQFYSPSTLDTLNGCAYSWQVDDVAMFEPAAFDGGVSQIIAPVSGCTTDPAAPVTVRIKNYGGTAISNFQVSMQINGGAPVTETVTSTINPNDSLDYTFTATANLSGSGIYAFAAYTSITADGDPSNDMITKNVQSGADNLLTAGYTMGFEPSDDLSLWAIEDVDADGVTFDLQTAYVHSGTVCLRAPFSTALAANTENWLYTSCLDLQPGFTYSLEYFYKVFDVASVSYSIESYVGNAQSSTSMTQLISADPAPPDTTYQQSLNTFTVSTAGTYYIGFKVFGSGIQNSFRLDDINITIATAINNIESNSSLVSIYPSPVSNDLNISLDKTLKNARIEIYNSSGGLVKTINNTAGIIKVDVSAYAKGIYTVKVIADSKVLSQRFTVVK